MARAKSARRVPPCFVGTADQVRPRVTRATSARRVPTCFVSTPTRCTPGWQGPCLPECAAGHRGPCMLVRHEVPTYTPSISGHGSATRAHRTRILEPHGLGAPHHSSRDANHARHATRRPTYAHDLQRSQRFPPRHLRLSWETCCESKENVNDMGLNTDHGTNEMHFCRLTTL